jgi:pilus assembly protein CpaB
MLGVAVLAGLLAVMLASRWLNAKSGSGMTKVAVAATDISLGQRLTPELVRMADWPAGSMPPGAIAKIGELEGRVLRINVLRGEPVLESKLAPVGTKGGLSAVIGEGKRAITVRVNDVIGVAGFALPGNYVDIIVNTQRESGDAHARDKNISKIVLERILVLAVAQEVSRDETRPKVVNAVTLEVTPEQAEKIDLARSVGTLSLVLRNQVDPLQVETAGATKSTLLAETVGAKVAEPAKPVKPSAPAPRRSTKSAAPVKADAPPVRAASCVGVINGLRNAQECY